MEVGAEDLFRRWPTRGEDVCTPLPWAAPRGPPQSCSLHFLFDGCSTTTWRSISLAGIPWTTTFKIDDGLRGRFFFRGGRNSKQGVAMTYAVRHGHTTHKVGAASPTATMHTPSP